MYQNFLKKGNGDHRFLMCPDLQYKNFEVLLSPIKLYKVDLECAKTVKYKPIVND